MEGEKIKILLFAVPALVMISLIVVMVGWAVYTSFTNEALVGKASRNPEYIGTQNYTKAFKDPDFTHSIKVTWLFTIGSAIIGQCVLGLLLAVILKQREIRGKALISTVILACWIIPVVVAGFALSSFWHEEGLANGILGACWLSPVGWLSDYPLLTIILANIWRGTGWSLLLFSSALETIPQDFYDAADVDGASSWHKFKTITFPLAKPVLIVNLFLITIWTYGYFDLPYILTGGGPGTATLLYPILVYKTSFAHYAIAYGSALTVYNILILLPLVAVYMIMYKRGR